MVILGLALLPCYYTELDTYFLADDAPVDGPLHSGLGRGGHDEFQVTLDAEKRLHFGSMSTRLFHVLATKDQAYHDWLLLAAAALRKDKHA